MKKVSQSVAILLCVAVSLCLLGGCSSENVTTPTTLENVPSTAPFTTGSRVQTTTSPVITSVKTTKPTAKPSVPQSSENNTVLAQQAVIETALAYLARGSRVQYADTRLATGDIVPSTVRYRWETGKHSPEDATSQYFTYTNCAAFTYDVYLHALNHDILSYTTASLIQKGSQEMMFKYYPQGNETIEERAQIEREFRDTLEPGDIIVVRYNGSRIGNGHAMLYVGEDVLKNVIAEKNDAPEGTDYSSFVTGNNWYTYDIIHSSGSNYNYSKKQESFESKGSIAMTSVDALFDPATSRYVFSKLNSVGIVRPLNMFGGEVPQETVNRINNLHGVVAEKLCSHTIGMTVNPGDEMTFTFSVENQTGKVKKLQISDIVPKNTTYVSGAQKVSGTALLWEVTVPAYGEISVSYTVKVNANAPYGEYIINKNGSVGGVSTVCPPVMVAKTLTAKQQDALKNAVQDLNDIDCEPTDLLNVIYREVCGAEAFPDSANDVLKKAFKSYYGLPDYYSPADKGVYAKMRIPTMYGGRATVPEHGVEEEYARTRLPYASQLMVGDVLIAAESEEDSQPLVLLLAGEMAYDLTNGMIRQDCDSCLEKVLGYNRFVILRPSMVM